MGRCEDINQFKHHSLLSSCRCVTITCSSSLSYVMFLLVFLEKTISLTTDLIIIQSSKERGREPEYHSTIDCCHQLLILSTGKLLITIGNKKKTRKKKNIFDFLVNNIQGCIIQLFQKEKGRTVLRFTCFNICLVKGGSEIIKE